jgi:hypothetical protein
MRSIFIAASVIVCFQAGACSGSDSKTCSIEAQTGCKDPLVCDSVVGGMPTCVQPVTLVGKVIDAQSMAGIAGARVVARDVDGAAVSNVATTIMDGTYKLTVAAPRDANGVPQSAVYTLRADAQGYQPFPGGIRVALPIDVKAAMPVAKDMPYTLTTPTTTIALVAIANASGLGRISGTVSAIDPKKTLVGGTLVVAGAAAMGQSAPTGVADRKGGYVVFNVPAGMQEVRGYLSGSNFKSVTANVAAGAETAMINLVEAGAATATVSGSLSVVNGGGGSATSVVLIVDDTFNVNLARGDVPKGLRMSNVTGAWSIAGVPDGKYAIIPSLENDGLVRDPDTGIAGTMIQHITVAGASVSATSFKVTGALDVIAPGTTSDPAPVMGNPTFTWQDDSSETGYNVVVFVRRPCAREGQRLSVPRDLDEEHERHLAHGRPQGHLHRAVSRQLPTLASVTSEMLR